MTDTRWFALFGLLCLLLSIVVTGWHHVRDRAWVAARECFLKADLEQAERQARIITPRMR